MKALAAVLAGSLAVALLIILCTDERAPMMQKPLVEAPPTPKQESGLEEMARTTVERTAVVDLQSPDQLAKALVESNAPLEVTAVAPVDVQVAKEISVALMKATDRQWHIKFFAEETGKHNALSDFADFWIAIHPELDRLVADGCVERVIERRPPPTKDGGQIPTNCCVNSLDSDVLTVRVCSDSWMVRLTFRENDRMPAKQLFEKVLSAQGTRKGKDQR